VWIVYLASITSTLRTFNRHDVRYCPIVPLRILISLGVLYAPLGFSIGTQRGCGLSPLRDLIRSPCHRVVPALRAWSTIGVRNLGHTANPNAKLNFSAAVSADWEIWRGRHVLGSHPFSGSGRVAVPGMKTVASYRFGPLGPLGPLGRFCAAGCFRGRTDVQSKG
jgi:hypothetical protein